jgi:hypothetical protein
LQTEVTEAFELSLLDVHESDPVDRAVTTQVSDIRSKGTCLNHPAD